MQLRKDILLFYLLILLSVGVIIAADLPVEKVSSKKAGGKCSKLSKPASSPLPLRTVTEGIFRMKA